jgi:hypothetical protein
MKKPVYETLVASLLLAFVVLLLLLPIYYHDETSSNYFVYCAAAGATVLSYGGGILLFLLFALGVVKILFAFLFKKTPEKEEQLNFLLYSIWIVLGLGYALVSFAGTSMIAFGLGLGLSFLGLLTFFLDYHFYGQD